MISSVDSSLHRGAVNEGLAQAGLLNHLRIILNAPRTPPLLRLTTSTVTAGSFFRQLAFEGNIFILGCRFSCSKEVNIGNMNRHFRKERDSLQQADTSANQYFSPFGSVLSNLSSLNLCYRHSRGKIQPPT